MALSNQPVSTEPLIPGLGGSAPQQQVPEPPLRPVNLWNNLGSAGLDAAGGQSSSGDGLLGEHLLLATAWPVKVPKGKAVLSDGLLASLGGSAAVGASVLIFKVKLAVDCTKPALLETRQRPLMLGNALCPTSGHCPHSNL